MAQLLGGERTRKALRRVLRFTGWSYDDLWLKAAGSAATRSGSVNVTRWLSGKVRPNASSIQEIAAGIVQHHSGIKDPWDGVGSTPAELASVACDLATDLIAALLADNWSDPTARWHIKKDLAPVVTPRLRQAWATAPHDRGAIEDEVVGRLARRYGYARSDRFIYPTASRFADAFGIVPGELASELDNRHLYHAIQHLVHDDREMVLAIVERLISR